MVEEKIQKGYVYAGRKLKDGYEIKLFVKKKEELEDRLHMHLS